MRYVCTYVDIGVAKRTSKVAVSFLPPKMICSKINIASAEVAGKLIKVERVFSFDENNGFKKSRRKFIKVERDVFSFDESNIFSRVL